MESKNYFKCSRNPEISILGECVTSEFILIYCDLLSAQIEREFNSFIFHASSPWTGLSLVLPPNHFYFPIKLMEYLKFGGQRKIQYVAFFTADARRSIPETAETNGNGAVFILKKCIWKTPKWITLLWTETVTQWANFSLQYESSHLHSDLGSLCQWLD